MTNPYRILFREARVPPPEGFYEVLRMHLPAKIAIGKGVTIWTQPPDDISRAIDCKFDVGPASLSSLSYLSKGPFFFSTDPQLDPLERIVTPGTGGDFREELINSAKITDDEQRLNCHRIIEKFILPAHEAKGHIEVNLSFDKSSYESKAIWLQLHRCLNEPNMNRFLGFPYEISEDFLFQHYISGTMHELYALLREESAWKRLAEETEFRPLTTNLKHAIRAKQDSLAVRLLRFLIDKSGNEITKVNKVIDEMIIKADMSLSHSLPHLIRDLGRGVEIDDMIDSVLEQTYRKFSAQYSRDKLDEMMKEQRQSIREDRSKPAVKALLSTYMSLSYGDSYLDISFCSQENGEYAISAITDLVVMREGKRILDRSGTPYPVSPLHSMEQSWTETLEEIADGRFRDRTDLVTNFDALADFRRFYLSWRPALLLAQRRVSSWAIP